MYKALKSFTGIVTMTKGEVRDLPEDVAKILIRSGVIVDLQEKQKKAARVRKSKNGEA